ncbi:MAG: FHA domain-containing protein, partial [Deltaproteobacteria bacterium]
MNVYELFLIKGIEPDQVYRLEEDEIIIGRDKSCQIALEGRTISRHHARIVRHEEDLFIEDLGSANGTFVNGVRVEKSVWGANDLIIVGKFELQLRQSDDRSYPTQEPSPRALPHHELALDQAPEQHRMVAQESRFPPSMTITETLSSSALMDLVSRSHASLGGMYRINSMSSSIFDLDV